jgi:hypothetical protein
MFRVELFCEDKNLPRVLRALTGLVTTTPKIQPVANAESVGGKIKQRTNGNAVDLFKAWATKNKLNSVTPSQMRDFAREHGYMETSYSLILKNLVLAKLVRKNPKTKGNRIAYTILSSNKVKA